VTGPGPRVFVLVRHRDVSGVSGTGVVAEGTVWSDGSACLRWPGRHGAAAFWPGGVQAIEAVHRHHGSTQVRYLDDPGAVAGAPGSGTGDGHRAGVRDDHQDVGGFCGCCGTVTPCSAMSRTPPADGDGHR
jgi:hypothetical protein